MLVATTAPAIAQAAATTPDRAYGLIGTWSCGSGAGGKGTMTFVRNGDESISLKNVFTTSDSGSGEFDESYHFDPRTAYWTWTATTPDIPSFNEVGTAGPWTAEKWFFDGTVTEATAFHGTVKEGVRMVYKSLGNDSFEREFESGTDNTWRVRSGSICRRVTP